MCATLDVGQSGAERIAASSLGNLQSDGNLSIRQAQALALQERYRVHAGRIGQVNDVTGSTASAILGEAFHCSELCQTWGCIGLFHVFVMWVLIINVLLLMAGMDGVKVIIK